MTARATAPATVPCCWPGATILCLGAGPSLTVEDLAACAAARPALRAVAVNSVYRQAPWADVLYAADLKWWTWQVQEGVPRDRLPPRLYSVTAAVQTTVQTFYPDVQILRRTVQPGVTRDPGELACGGHSGYQAINLAAHLVGPGGRILLLGYDMMPAVTPDGGVQHHAAILGEHRDGTHPTYAYRLGAFAALTPALANWNITLVNCSRQTAISATVVPQYPLATMLPSGIHG